MMIVSVPGYRRFSGNTGSGRRLRCTSKSRTSGEGPPPSVWWNGSITVPQPDHPQPHHPQPLIRWIKATHSPNWALMMDADRMPPVKVPWEKLDNSRNKSSIHLDGGSDEI